MFISKLPHRKSNGKSQMSDHIHRFNNRMRKTQYFFFVKTKRIEKKTDLLLNRAMPQMRMTVSDEQSGFRHVQILRPLDPY